MTVPAQQSAPPPFDVGNPFLAEQPASFGVSPLSLIVAGPGVVRGGLL